MTVRGRDELTRNLLLQIFSTAPDDWQVEVIVNIDGMHDKTLEMLGDIKGVIIPLVDFNDSYWAKGMKRAEDYAVHNLNYDYLIWVNNDISIKENSLNIVSKHMQNFETSILTGSFHNSNTEKVRKTYGGSYYPRFRSMAWYKPLPIVDFPINAKVANGNFLVFPKAVYQSLGGIDGRYQHGNADSDISLRASRLGISLYVIPGTLGICDNNPRYFNRSFLKMFLYEFSKKRSPLADIRLLCKAQHSKLWIILFLDFILAIFVRQTRFWLIFLKKLYYPTPWIKNRDSP
jgi:GT2 family glycosyltransferase